MRFIGTDKHKLWGKKTRRTVAIRSWSFFTSFHKLMDNDREASNVSQRCKDRIFLYSTITTVIQETDKICFVRVELADEYGNPMEGFSFD